MSFYMAELDNENNVIRVIISPYLEWATETLGGTWVETGSPEYIYPNKRYCGIGWKYYPDLDQFFPWQGAMETHSIWCLTSDWSSIPIENRIQFLDETSLGVVNELYLGIHWTVFGGREITYDDVVLLTDYLNNEFCLGFPIP